MKKKTCKHEWNMGGGRLHTSWYQCSRCGEQKTECNHKWHIIALPPPPQGGQGSWHEAAAICEYCFEKRYI